MDIPLVRLNNGVDMPQLGLGTWQLHDGKEVAGATKVAIESGYRLIDTAAMYDNERGIGAAIKAGQVARERLYITTKLWNGDHGHKNALKAFNASLQRLQLEYIDLYLIHWPLPMQGKYIETWKALEEMYASGRAKAIGVSNFNAEHLDALTSKCDIVPAVNQIELHPYFQQKELREYCRQKGIQVESWSPLGGTGGTLTANPVIMAIAKKYNRPAHHIVLRWHVQQGLIVVPKSKQARHIRANTNIFSFSLEAADMAAINGLETGHRLGPNPATMNRGIPTGIARLASRLGLVTLKNR